jgi:TetR/AcrR family transcriptional repressor of nem operon
MARTSKEESARLQIEIVKAAVDLFSSHGLQAISVPRVMAAVGKTHGGFYRRFGSKDRLAAEACRALFNQILQQLRDTPSSRYDARSLQRDMPEFRALALLATDAARSDSDSEFRSVYLNGICRLLKALSNCDGAGPLDSETILAATLGGFILQEARNEKEFATQSLTHKV